MKLCENFFEIFGEIWNKKIIGICIIEASKKFKIFSKTDDFFSIKFQRMKAILVKSVEKFDNTFVVSGLGFTPLSPFTQYISS